MLPDILKIVLVDDHPIVLEGLRSLINKQSNLSVEAAFTTGKELLSYLSQSTTDVVLLDISLPDINGMELCKEIKKYSPETVILILSNHTERSIIMQTIQNGANGYLLKNASLHDLQNAIHKALDGNIVYGREIQEIISRPSQSEFTEMPQITKREKEILYLLAEGKTSNEIAQQLFLSALTVDTHRKNLIQKFKVKNVAELIKEATRQQFL